MIIFKQNLKRMLSRKNVIIYFSFFIPFFYLFGYLYEILFTQGAYSSVNSMIDKYLSTFFIVTFIWTLGFPLLVSTVKRGALLIQQEIDEDTLIMLVSKPIDRKQLMIEKVLASLTVTTIISFVSILMSISIFIIFFRIDGLIIRLYLSLIPSIFIYSLFINFIFTSISLFVASILKHSTKSIIILIVIIILFLLGFPLFKQLLVSSGIYDKYFIYLFDFNYHFGLIYYRIVNLFSTVTFTPLSQVKIAQFIGIFKQNMDTLDPELQFIPAGSKTVGYLNPMIVAVFWLFLAIIFMYLSFLSLKRKDIE